MVSKKKNIVISIIGLLLFAIGIGLFVFSFSFKRATITFLNDDGSVIAVMPTAVGKSRTIDETTFSSKSKDTQLGYEAKFKGWSIPGQLSLVKTVEMKEEKDIVVTAVYDLVKAKYTIKYTGIAKFSDEENKKKITSYDIDTPSFEFPRPINANKNVTNGYGYTFAGWDDRNTETVEHYFEFVSGEHVGELSLMVTWIENDNGIDFGEDTQYIDDNSIIYGYNSANGLSRIPTPERAGYRFLGWYDNPQFTGNKIESIQKGTTGNLSLYAKWELIEYSITYDYNGGTLVEGQTAVNSYTIDSETFNLPVLEKEGYIFKGWDKTITPSVETWTEIKKGSVGNLNLIAVFEEE